MNSKPNNKKRFRNSDSLIGLGIAIGAGIGVALGNIATGIAFGIGVGIAMSKTFEKRRKKPDGN